MSVTKILLRHNRTGAGTLPAADSTRCGEPLWFKNKLYIRSQNAEEIVNPHDYGDDTAAWAAAVAQLRQTYQEGNPIFVGPYEHPARQTGSQLEVNVEENTQSSTEDYVYTGPGAITDNWRWYRALTGIVTDKDGHVITAEAGLSLQLHPSSVVTVPRFCENNTEIRLAMVKSEGHGAIGNQFPVGISIRGKGYINETGSLEAVDNGPAAMVENYQWNIGSGDCLVVTDSDWSSHTSMGSSIDGNSSYNNMMVRSKLSFDTTQNNKFLCQNGTWATPSAGGGSNVAAATGDTTVKGVVAGSVSIDGVQTEFSVQPANSYLGGKSGEYYYTGQGVVRPLGTTTGRQSQGAHKLLYTSEDTQNLNTVDLTVLSGPKQIRPGAGDQTAQWAAIPVYVDFHRVDGTERVEAVPYIMLPKELLEQYMNFWTAAVPADGGVEGTNPPGSNTIVYDDNN